MICVKVRGAAFLQNPLIPRVEGSECWGSPMCTDRRTGLRSFRVLLMMSAALAPLPAFAQTGPGEPGQSPPRSEEAGRFEASLEVGATYIDNIFVTRRDEVDDLVVTVRPSARWTLGQGDRRLSAYARGELGRFEEYDSEDYDDWTVGADGRYAVAPGAVMIGGGDYEWRHESRASPEAVRGLEPTEYERSYLYGGLLLRRGGFSGRLAATATGHDFSDVPASGGIINNDDRDRTQTELGARLGWLRKADEEWFVQGGLDRRDYDAPLDDFGFDRDSDGVTLALGLRRNLSRTLSAEAFAGVMRQSWEDPRLGEITAFDFGAVVDWTGPAGVDLGFRLDRSIGETTLPGAPAYVATNASLDLSATPHPRLQVGVGADATHYDYQGAARSETSAGLRGWGRYWVDPRVYVGLEHAFTQRTSTAAGFDYDENRLMLRLGAQLQPRTFGEAGALVFDQAAPGGLYVGALAGHGVLSTGLDGPRGAGSNTADFADMGPSYGVMAGFGWTSGPVYLGLEAEGFAEGPEWRHEADRLFWGHKENSLGLSGRLGWVTAGRDLLYVRAGVHSAAFHDTYLHSTHVAYDANRRTGLGAGFGIEADAGDRAFVRAEYLVTSWEDYEVPTGTATSDNFSNSESQFRVGGGIRFGGPMAAAPVPAADFAGPYLGVRFGHGALLTDNEGARSGGTTIDIIRGTHGPVAGVFAGYGQVFGRLYAGVEAGVDVAGINWNIERDPNGRIYSTERGDSVAVSARLGWRFGESALAYGHLGAVRTRFDIPYETSNVSVHSKEDISGVRAGVGLEVALGERTSLRIDYAITDYERYDVAYSSNSDSFDHEESLTTIGLVWRPW